MTVLLQELDDAGAYERVDVAIRALRDEIVAVNFTTTRGQNRLWSLVAAKLEEARGLAVQAYEEAGRLALVDRAEVLRGLTEPTETTDGSNVVRT